MLGEIIVKQASCAHILVCDASVLPSFRVLTDLIFHLTVFKLVCVFHCLREAMICVAIVIIFTTYLK